MSFIKNIIHSFLNFLIAKKKRSIYFNFDISTKNNCHDVFNYSGDNALCLLHQLCTYVYDKPVYFCTDYFDDNRFELYKAFANSLKNKNIQLEFVRSYRDKTGIKKFTYYFKFLFKLFKCRLWIVGSGDQFLPGKLKCQKIFDTNYFISCKNDFIPGKNYRWSFLDLFLSTSLLDSTISSAQLGVKLDRCVELGFPRNDTLFTSSKKDVIIDWIKEELGYVPDNIIVYAPTYRDYEKNNPDAKSRYLFGYEISQLDAFLKRNKTCIIAKMHNLTNKSILIKPESVIYFKICYDFTFYDLMAIADCVITDYSSLGYDFMLLNRPIIYNLYDLEKYIKDRGLSYDPYDFYCGGEIVADYESMQKALSDVINGVDNSLSKRKELIRIFHKFKDNDSSKRVADYVKTRFL